MQQRVIDEELRVEAGARVVSEQCRTLISAYSIHVLAASYSNPSIDQPSGISYDQAHLDAHLLAASHDNQSIKRHCPSVAHFEK